MSHKSDPHKVSNIVCRCFPTILTLLEFRGAGRMCKRILVPMDGDPFAEARLPHKQLVAKSLLNQETSGKMTRSRQGDGGAWIRTHSTRSPGQPALRWSACGGR